jgi:hypothetical protein
LNRARVRARDRVRVRDRVRDRVRVRVRVRVGGCGEHVPALVLSRDDQLVDPDLGRSPRVLVPVHGVKALGVLRREEVLGADLCSGSHVSESRGGSAGRISILLTRTHAREERRRWAGGCLLFDGEEEPDHADQREKRRASDDRPGLAANEVAPLVEEGVDAVLDSLAELARARDHEAFGKHRLLLPRCVATQGCRRGAFFEALLEGNKLPTNAYDAVEII